MCHRFYKHWQVSLYLFSLDIDLAALSPHCLHPLSLNASVVNQTASSLPPQRYLRDYSNEVHVGIMGQKAACKTVSYKGSHYGV